MLATVLLGWAPALPAAHAGPVPDSTGLLTPWVIRPEAPCDEDSVTMIVRGFLPTLCDSFMGAEAITPLFVRIRLQEYVDRRCPEPSAFTRVPVPLGVFPAGPHMGIVEVVTTQVRNDGSSTILAQQFRFDFEVAAECSIPPPPPPPPPGQLPYVNSITTEPPRPCAGRPTSLVLAGEFPDGCGQVIDAFVWNPYNVSITLKVGALRDTACTLPPVPWRQEFNLGPLPSGPHQTNITVVLLRPDSTGTALVHEFHYASHEFFVYGDCDSIPPPPPGPLPYVQYIAVRRPIPCFPVWPALDMMAPQAPCPGESLMVEVAGAFPNDCFSFRRIELIPAPVRFFPPPPPTVRIIVDDGCCTDRFRYCIPEPVTWGAFAKLPPMAAGDYRLKVELAQVCCSDTYPPGELYATEVPFSVADSCPVPGPCLTVDFASGPELVHPSVACNATIALGRPAELTFLVRPTVALAGLQGEFRLEPSLLRITGITPIESAQGMIIDWTPTADGARFVLFAKSGAPIPPYPPTDQLGGGWPVLRVTVEYLNRGGSPPERTVVTADNILGSDIDGRAVLTCPPPPCVRLAPPRAIICGEIVCDFNQDGLQDVRDLVRMVHCVTGEGPCPPVTTPSFDCNGDATFGLADVLCCARHVLQRVPCPDCPPDTGQVRPEPAVAVSLGTPESRSSGITLPVLIDGATLLGGAMLMLEAPLDRYEVTGFDANPSSDWLALHEVRDGKVVLGLIDVRDSRRLDIRASSSFTLTLALRPGQASGGRVTVVAGEFSGRDGVTLGVDLGRPSQPLPGGAPVALGANQPNPFSTETAFTLDLAAAADVAIAIYDLRGRAIASLHRAPLGSGPHVFRWDGRRTDGSFAPNGVYFYQATVGGKSVARKLILMRKD